MAPNRGLSGFLRGKRLCWDVGPALLYQKCSVGLKYAKTWTPAAVEAQVLRVTTKKGHLFIQKVHPRSFYALQLGIAITGSRNPGIMRDQIPGFRD